MRESAIPAPVAAALILIVVLAAGFFLYRGVTGGTVGDGHNGRVEASPPMPNAAKEQLMRDMGKR